VKILGISGSSRKNEISGTYKLVKETLEATGCEYELVSLRGKCINGCIACLGCVKDNVCVINDGMESLRDLIVEADAYVIGAPNYYTMLNGVTHCFLERFYQFRHQEGDTLWGKLAIAVGVGGVQGQICCEQIERFLAYNFIETVDVVSGQGAACCYTCGYGETCKVGGVVMMHGEGYKITKENIPDVAKCPKTLEAARNAGRLLGERLRNDHDRQKVTQKMQQFMMEKFKEST
jgi:multimeric flavodoxin WrbA